MVLIQPWLKYPFSQAAFSYGKEERILKPEFHIPHFITLTSYWKNSIII